MGWQVYLARCADGSLYTGVTTDPAARIRAHNTGRGAAYTRSRRPVTLVWSTPAPSRGEALRREYRIKQWPRARKERLAVEGGGMAVERFEGFRPAGFDFLRKLRRNNRRDWFQRHKAVYETEIRQPMAALVEEVDARLGAAAPEITGEPRRSIFRIYRDTRFSRDKSPYKTHAACWFYHRDSSRGVGREAARGGAGYYFHVAPGECLLGGGIWMPPREDLNRIRDAIVQDPDRFRAILWAPAFRRRFRQLEEEGMLQRLPRGYPPASPAAPWLRHLSFIVSRRLTVREVQSRRLPGILMRDFTVVLPLVRFLNEALGLGQAERR